MASRLGVAGAASPMDADLTPVVAALANLSDAELHALMDTTYKVPQIAPGLLAWLEGACDWELNRRRGFDYPLQLPEAAIDPSEDAIRLTLRSRCAWRLRMMSVRKPAPW